MNSPSNIDKLLHAGNPELASLITRVRVLERYTRWLRGILPAPLNIHCCVADIQKQEITIGVDNAVWATKLRFLANNLLLQAQHAFRELREIRHLNVLVLDTSRSSQTKIPASNSLHISKENANQIKLLADTMVDDGLRAALQRLANHAGNK